MKGSLDVGRRFVVEEDDGDGPMIPFADVRCWVRLDCGGAKLSIRKHDKNRSLHWRCPKCGSYYGEAKRESSGSKRNG